MVIQSVWAQGRLRPTRPPRPPARARRHRLLGPPSPVSPSGCPDTGGPGGQTRGRNLAGVPLCPPGLALGAGSAADAWGLSLPFCAVRGRTVIPRAVPAWTSTPGSDHSWPPALLPVAGVARAALRSARCGLTALRATLLASELQLSQAHGVGAVPANPSPDGVLALSGRPGHLAVRSPHAPLPARSALPASACMPAGPGCRPSTPRSWPGPRAPRGTTFLCEEALVRQLQGLLVHVDADGGLLVLVGRAQPEGLVHQQALQAVMSEAWGARHARSPGPRQAGGGRCWPSPALTRPRQTPPASGDSQ